MQVCNYTQTEYTARELTSTLSFIENVTQTTFMFVNRESEEFRYFLGISHNDFRDLDWCQLVRDNVEWNEIVWSLGMVSFLSPTFGMYYVGADSHEMP